MDNDNLEILIQAILSLKDTTKSKNQILSELPKLEGQLQSDKNARIKIIAGLDVAKSKKLIQSQLATITNQANAPTINVGISAGNQSAVQNISAGLKNVQAQAQQTASAVGKVAEAAQKAKDVGTIKVNQQNDLNKFIAQVSGNSKVFGLMKQDVDNLKSSLSSITDSTSLTQYLNQLDNAKTKFASLKALYSSIAGYDKQLDNLAKSWQKQGIYAGNIQKTVESLKASLANVTTADGLTAWVGDFNSQIGAISQLPVKIAEYRNQLNTVRDEWKQQGIYVGEIANKTASLARSLPNIKKPEKFDAWVKEWTELNNQATKLKVNLDSQVTSQNKIYEIQSQIAKLNPQKDTAEIARLNEKLNAEQKTLSNLQMQSNVFSNLITLEEQEKYITEQTATARERMISATNGGIKTYTTQVESNIKFLQSLQSNATFKNNASNPEVVKAKADIATLIGEYQKLKTQLQGNVSPEGLKAVEAELTKLNLRFNTAATNAKNLQTTLADTNGVEKLTQKINLLIAKLEAYKAANPKAMKQFGTQIDGMLSSLRSGNLDSVGVDRINKQFQTLRQEIILTGKAGKGLFQTLADNAAKFFKWMSMTYVISTLTRSIRSMITSVVELDTALVDLKKTFTGTETDLENFYISANQTAKDLGVTTKEIINQAAAWSRLGYSSAETAELMAKNSAIFKTISPGMDMDTATDGLVSMMKAFDIEANNVLDGIMSKVNIVGRFCRR